MERERNGSEGLSVEQESTDLGRGCGGHDRAAQMARKHGAREVWRGGGRW